MRLNSKIFQFYWIHKYSIQTKQILEAFITNCKDWIRIVNVELRGFLVKIFADVEWIELWK